MTITATQAAPRFEAEPDPDVQASSPGSRAGEAVRYLAASIAALALDAGLLWAGVVGAALPAWAAGAVGYGAGLVLVYLLSVHWVFRRRTLADARSEFLMFALLGCVGLVLNSLVLYVATGLGLAVPAAKILSAAIGFVANFVSRKLLLFTKPSA